MKKQEYKYCGTSFDKNISFEDFVNKVIPEGATFKFEDEDFEDSCDKKECDKQKTCISCERNESLKYCGDNYPEFGIYKGDHYDDVIEAIIENISGNSGVVVVKNSDSSYQIEVEAGDILTLPNISFTTDDGVVFTYPSVKDILEEGVISKKLIDIVLNGVVIGQEENSQNEIDITGYIPPCPPAEIVIQNTNNSYNETVYSDFTIPDTEFKVLLKTEDGVNIIHEEIVNIVSVDNTQSYVYNVPNSNISITVFDQNGNQLGQYSNSLQPGNSNSDLIQVEGLNSSIQLQNSNGTLLGGVLEVNYGEENGLVIVPDTQIVVEDELGNQIGSTVNQPSGEVVTITVNNSNVTILDSQTNILGTLTLPPESTSTFNVSDSEITLKNSQNTTLNTTNVRATQPLTLTAPDVNIIVVDTESNIVLEESVPSGTTYNYELPPQGTQVFGRQVWWLDRPDTLEKGIYFLVEHFEGIEQIIYWFSNKSTNIYIDDVLITNIPASTPTFLPINGDDYGTYKDGRKQSWIFFESPENPDINFFNNDISYHNRFLNVLEELVNLDVVGTYSREDLGAVYRVQKNTQSIWFKPGMTITNGVGLFMGSNISNIENLPEVLGGNMGETWRDSTSYPAIFDASYVTSWIGLAYTFYSTSQVKFFQIKIINAGHITNLNNSFSANRNVVSIEIDDCSSVTNGANFAYGCSNLQKLLLWGLRSSIDLPYCTKMSKQALIDMIDSFSDMTGFSSPTVNLTGIPDATDTDVITLAGSKNWTIIV